MYSRLKMAGVGLAIICCSVCGAIHAAENYIKNGDFEQVEDGQAAFWKTTGTVKPEQVSGGWQKLAGAFKSGPQANGSFPILCVFRVVGFSVG